MELFLRYYKEIITYSTGGFKFLITLHTLTAISVFNSKMK